MRAITSLPICFDGIRGVKVAAFHTEIVLSREPEMRAVMGCPFAAVLMVTRLVMVFVCPDLADEIKSTHLAVKSGLKCHFRIV